MNTLKVAKIVGVMAAAALANPTVSIFVKDPSEMENFQKNLEVLRTDLGEGNPQIDEMLNRASKIAQMNDRCASISLNDVLDEDCGRFYSVELPEFEMQYMELTGELRLNTVKMGNSLAERTEQIQVCANTLGAILVSKDKLLKLNGNVDLEPLDLAGAFDATYDFTLYFDSMRMEQQKKLMDRWVEKCSDVVLRKAHDEFAPLFVDRISFINDSLTKNNANIKIVLEPEYLDFYLDLNKPVTGSYFLNGVQLFNVESLPMGRNYAHIIVNLLERKVNVPLGIDGKMQNFRGRVEFTAAYQEKDLMGRWIWGTQKDIRRAKVKGEISSEVVVGDSTKPAPIVRKLASIDTTAIITSVADTAMQETAKDAAATEAAKDVADKNDGSKKSWIPPVIAGAVMIGGGITAAVFNSKAKSQRDKKPANKDEYDSICDKIDNAQTGRAIGIGIAAVGLVGLGITLMF